jgi:hypothetical protein
MSWCVCICVYMVFFYMTFLWYDIWTDVYRNILNVRYQQIWKQWIPTINQSINQSNVNITYNLQIYHTMSNNGCPSPTTVNLTTDEILSNLRAKTRKGGTLWMWSRTFRNINWYRYLNIYIYYIDNYVRTYVRLCMYVCMYIDNYVSVCVYI